MITREQVADLKPGDVVELTSSEWPDGTVVRGPLWLFDGETLQVGRMVVRHYGRQPFDNTLTLTVVSRAPHPLYVNHPRTYCVEGDVVRDAEDDSPPTVLVCANPDEGYDWWYGPGQGFIHRDSAPARLRLLVDGETGQVVP